MFAINRYSVVRGMCPHSLPKYQGDDEKESEETELCEESYEHDGLAEFCTACLCHHSTSAGLHKKCDDIADNKDLGYTGWSDEGGFWCVDEEGDSAIDHIYRSCVKGWRQDDKQSL